MTVIMTVTCKQIRSLSCKSHFINNDALYCYIVNREKKEATKKLELQLKAEIEKKDKELATLDEEKKTEIARLEARLKDLEKQRDKDMAKIRGEKQVLQKEKDELLLRFVYHISYSNIDLKLFL